MRSAGSDEARQYRMVFEHQVEGAAFVAALSRFLNSPAGSPYLSGADAAEVRGQSPPSGGLELYLSDSALAAATVAFSPLPAVQAISFDALPETCAILIAGRTVPWGLDQAQELLTGRRT